MGFLLRPPVAPLPFPSQIDLAFCNKHRKDTAVTMHDLRNIDFFLPSLKKKKKEIPQTICGIKNYKKLQFPDTHTTARSRAALVLQPSFY